MAFDMTFEMDEEARARVDGFFKLFGTQLRDVRQRASFAMYALGLMDKTAGQALPASDDIGCHTHLTQHPRAALACHPVVRSQKPGRRRVPKARLP